MKKQKLFLVILVILFLGLAGWRFWGARSLHTNASGLKRRSANVAQIPTSSLSPMMVNALYTPGQIQAGHAINAMLSRNPNAVIPMAQLVAAGVSKEDLTKGFQDAQNAQPIEVYGKVVDQNGNPIPAVKVHGGVLINVGIENSGSKNYETETDGQGLFNFNDLHGVSFGAGFDKPGYEYNSKLYTTWWDTYKPDPTNPMIFTMYKLQGAEPMVHQDFHFLIPCDGTPTGVNLTIGKVVTTGGDITISFSRTPEQIHRGTPFEWTLTLDVPGGGLIEMHDRYPYEAPESGYQETTTIGTGPSPKKYADSANQVYYFKSTDGKYGRIAIEFQADFQPPPTFMHLDVYLNPSGSRNLEWDSAKEIKPQ